MRRTNQFSIHGFSKLGFSALGILLLAAVLAARLPGVAAPEQGTEKPVDFSRDIRPILSENCFTCHGPDPSNRQAGLRLDTSEGLFRNRGGDRGGYQILVPGDSAKSRLFQRISAKEEVLRMPPVWAERNLTTEQIELIRRWIDQGAEWKNHWSFVAPKRPALPVVKSKTWPRNPIDRFILARLETEGLNPSPQADKATLLRRVSLDLTGLPPTPEEIDAFLADKSPDAYEKRVERLLASPHYGERMAMQWLDLARYADTHGYHIDSLRSMWPWRDWVIQAFNDNMPFDRFTTEQLAGDLLPNATRAQKVATGFNRNHMINFEGGAIPEEYRNEYVIDRLETTSTTWLGLTMGCARCHDHKFDPLKQRDFYRFYAFFNSVTEKGLDGRLGNARPFLPLPTAEQQKRLDKLEAEIATVKEALPDKKVTSLVENWKPTALDKISTATNKGLLAHYEFEGNLDDSSGAGLHGRTVRGEVNFGEGSVGQGGGFDAQTHAEFPIPAFERDKPFTLTFWLGTGTETSAVILENVDPTEERRGFEFLRGEPKLVARHTTVSPFSIRLSHRWSKNHEEANGMEIETTKPRSGYGYVTITYDGAGKASGVKLYWDGELQVTKITRDNLSGPLRTTRPLAVGNKKRGRAFSGELDDLRLYDRVLSTEELEQLRLREPMRGRLRFPLEGCNELILAFEEMKKDPDYDDVNNDFFQSKKGRKTRACMGRRSATRNYYLTHVASESDRAAHAKLEKLEGEQGKLTKAVSTTMVMVERAEPRETFILKRGDYRNKTEKVTPGTPSILPPMPKDTPTNRLGLARWLTDPGHPLTARVTVNRYWQKYFGTGIVKTSENFGSQGEPPSHPALLDWLAREFISTGWDVKAMQRLIVTSAVYRQSSKVTPELLKADSLNRLLARGPRFRLPAEVVRDNALAVSGLLVRDIGGPSIHPYQPKGLWKDVAYGGGYTAQEYEEGTGKDLYRRSMYTIWKRTLPPPSLGTFDAPDREKCTSRRARTNTPLQALVLMNDPTYVEAARALAERMLTERNGGLAARARYGFRLATGRHPGPGETAVLLKAAREQLAAYQSDQKSARELLQVGESRPDKKLDTAELAAWTTVAGIILNLDETLTKE